MKSKNYLVVIAIVFCLTFNLIGCRDVSVEESRLSETIIIDEADVSSENNFSIEDTTSLEEKPVVSEPVNEPVTSKEEAPAPEKKPSQPTQNTTSESKPVQNQASSSTPTTNKKFVQRANTETGISWDGVSPIVYTYADGTTGTEKKEGATYEAYPGMTTTVVTIKKGNGNYSLHCDDCGKTMGDGTNDTCLSYWTGGDHACQNCGDVIPENTCHTCDE